MDYISRIKWRIKEILIQKNISIYQLANRTELSSACIHNWYSKRNYTPSLSAILKICEVLEISPIELFRDETDETVCVSKEEKALLNNWTLLGEKQKHLLNLQIQSYLEK